MEIKNASHGEAVSNIDDLTLDNGELDLKGGKEPENDKKPNKPKKAIDMTEGPFLKKMLFFAIPIVLTGFLQNFYNAADLVVVSNFSNSDAPLVGAIGCTAALINLVLGLFMGLSVGAGVLAAHYIGAKKYKDVNVVLHTSALLSVIFGLIIAVLGFVFTEPMLIAMGTSKEILPYATLYLKIIFCGTPGSLLYNYIASILRSSGDSKRPLIFLAIAGLVNVILNIIFVTAFGMDVDGVALSTIASQYLAAFMAVTYLIKQKGYLHFSFKRLRIDVRKLKRLLYIGIPSGIQGSLFSLSNTFIQASMNSIDTVAGAGGAMIDGFSATSNLENFVYIAMNAVYSVALTFVGQNVGAQKYKNIKKLVLYAVFLVTMFGVLLGGFMLIFQKPLLGLYGVVDGFAMEAAVERIRIIIPTYFLCGIMEVLCGTLRALNKSVTSMIISVMTTAGLRILWIHTIFAHFGTGTSLFLSYPVSWTLSILVHLIFIIGVTKKILKRQREELVLELPN